MAGDLLSDLLAPLRLHGVFFSRWLAHAPWGISGDRESCALLHYVVSGVCVTELPGGDPVRLEAGDLAVFPHGTAHTLGDRPGRATVPLSGVLPEREPGEVCTVEIAGPGERTLILCGGLHYDRVAAAPLYQSLPPLLVLRRERLHAHPLLGVTLERLAGEWDNAAPGAQLVALRAFEMVFVLALRAAMEGDCPDGRPVMGALRHEGVAAALRAVQTRFAEPWTVETLATEAGMSRSAFSAAFTRLLGQAPMRHLTARRMQEAARLLTETTLAHNRISERVGYGSPVGFHLAFKQWYGMTPGEYRSAPQTR
ncbi:AraC-type DNA-binding protein [Sinosporangium album]|uniref:AraC-type DNA-binding protein n=1 Tax=Sinosporangium album TaxID=504805 RepID=A0A1G8LFC9_9ACTN|nr:AraC family transcriptional regulator [Sinosporangium album]SDI54432.1 AraC-type DNA-binding protein [Sinosporangium album]